VKVGHGGATYTRFFCSCECPKLFAPKISWTHATKNSFAPQMEVRPFRWVVRFKKKNVEMFCLINCKQRVKTLSFTQQPCKWDPYEDDVFLSSHCEDGLHIVITARYFYKSRFCQVRKSDVFHTVMSATHLIRIYSSYSSFRRFGCIRNRCEIFNFYK